MRYIFIGIAGVLTAFTLAFIMADDVEYVGAAPTAVTYQKSLLPLTDSTYEIGTSTNAWLRGNFDELCLTGSTCISSWLAGGGGGGGTTLYVQNGGATLNTATTTLNFTSNSFSFTESPTDTFIIGVATTTLGLLTTNVSEGSNLYYTDARVSAYMSASSTYSNLISFYTTPSGRITAGTGIDWSGNTLNGVYTAGDALTLNGEDFDFDGGATPAGALGGTWASPTVDNDGHSHTGATLSGVDISADTNLTVTATGLELSADAIALSAGYVIPTTTRALNWDTAFTWGNHASAGYDQVTTAGDGLTRTVNDFDCDTASGTVFGCLSAANWTTFNNKQDTITAGDALTLTGTDIDFDGGATPSGDLGGTWASPSVTDDSHAHTGTTLSGIDISGDTNLSADGTEIVLTGDALSLGTALTFTTGTSTTAFFSGLGTFTNAFVNTLLTAAAATFTGLVDIGAGILEIPNGTGPTSNDVGELSHDTTDNQLILDDYVIRTKSELYQFSIASTSAFFTSGVTKLFPVKEDGYVVSDIFCTVEGGTSKAITVFGEAITCDVDGQADDGSISIATVGAASTTVGIVMGATTGTVNAVNVTITGTFTRE